MFQCFVSVDSLQVKVLLGAFFDAAALNYSLCLSLFTALYSGTTISLGRGGDKCECVCVPLFDGKQKVMEHHGPYCNKECVMGAQDLPSHKDIRGERQKDREQKRLPMPPLPANKSAVKTRGCKNVMAKS